MGTMPIGKLIAVMSLPAMISMLVQALYNVVDSMFVSAIGGTEGANALEAVSIAFPLQTLYMAFAIGVAVGSNSLIARALGEKDRRTASKVASTGLVVSLVHCAIFMILGATVTRPVARLFADGNTQVEDMVVEYMSVCLIFSAGMFVEVFINKVNQAMSRMVVPMISQLIGAITNIILDPIFIFTLGLGVKGAAIATVIGQFAAMIFTVVAFAVKKSEVSIGFKYIRIKGSTLLDIYRIGLPTIILNAVSSFTVMAMNIIFGLFNSEYGVTILGTYFKVQSFIFMPCFGLNQGILPIMAYNYGANDKKRFVKTYKLALIIALCIMAVGVIIFQTLSGVILGAFKSIAENEVMFNECKTAFRIISVCFLPAGLSIITITMFQSVGYGVNSMLMSILRQLVILLPAAVLLCATAGVAHIWWAYPIAEFAVIAVFFPIGLNVIKKVFERKYKEAADAV